MPETPEVPVPGALSGNLNSPGVTRVLAGRTDGLGRRRKPILKKVLDQGNRERGALLHQPVSGAGDHCFADIRRDVAHDDSLSRAKRFLAADRKYRHRQLGLLEDFVVLHILREGGELRETGPHRPGQSILRRVDRLA